MRVWPILLSALLLISCSNEIPEEKSFESSQLSNFTVSTIEKKESLPGNASFSEAWKEFNNLRSFELKACIRTESTMTDIPFTNFRIKMKGLETKKKTDNAGCLHWSYKHEFDYLADEVFYLVPITFIGADNYEGKVTTEIAVNPWSGQMIDRPNDLDHDLIYSDEENRYSKHKLFINNFNFTKISNDIIKDDNGQLIFPYELRFNPEFSRKSLKGIEKNESISKGDFELSLTLIQANDRGNARIISNSLTKISAESGNVIKTINMQQDPAFKNENEKYILLVKLVAKNSPINFEPLMGSILMDGLEKSNSTKLLYDYDNYEMLLTDTKLQNSDYGVNKNFNSANDILPEFKLSYFTFEDQDDVTLDIDSTLEVSRNTRFRRFKIAGKLLNPFSPGQAAPIVNGDFTFIVKNSDFLTKDANEDQQLRIKADGTFHAFVHIPYDIFAQEKNIALNIEIKCTSGQWKASKASTELIFNPWQQKGYNESEAPMLSDVEAPKLFAEQISFTDHEIDDDSFYINRNMNVSFDSNYTIEIPLKFRRFKHNGYEPLVRDVNTGEYIVEALVLTPKNNLVEIDNINFDDFTFITGAKTKMTVSSSGLLAGNLRFPFLMSERLLLNLKNLLVVTIKPVDKNSPLREVTLLSPFYGRFKNNKTTVFESSESLPQSFYTSFVRGILSPQRDFKIKSATNPINKSFSSIESYRSSMNKEKSIAINISAFNNNLDEKYHLSTSEVKSFHKKSSGQIQNIIRKFCRYRFITESARKQKELCLKRPFQFFRAMPTVHIEQVKDHSEKIFSEDGIAKGSSISRMDGDLGRGKMYLAGTGYSSNHWNGSVSNESTELSKSVGFESFLPLSVNFKANEVKSFSLFDQRIEGTNQSGTHRSFSKLTTDAEYERISVVFEAKVKNCIKVFNDEFTYHICNDISSPKRIKENWFYIGTPAKSKEGILIDSSFKLDGESFFSIIRGDYNFMKLWDTYLKEDNSYIIKYNNDIDISDGILKFQEDNRFDKVPVLHNQNNDNSYPGLFIPIDFDLESKL